MRRFGWALLLGALVGGCRGDRARTTDAALPVSAPAPATAVSRPALALDDATLQGYIRYERERLALVRRLLDQVRQQPVAASAPASSTGSAGLLAAASSYREQLERGSAELRAQAGLGAEQTAEISALVDAVIVARLAWQQAGGDGQLASIERRFAERLATLPTAERPPIEAEFRRLIGEVTAMRDAAEARLRYGDAAVELVLGRARELTALREQQIRLGEDL